MGCFFSSSNAGFDHVPIVLVLCTGNSCRSHIGQAFLQKACGKDAIVLSAGSKPVGYVVSFMYNESYDGNPLSHNLMIWPFYDFMIY